MSHHDHKQSTHSTERDSNSTERNTFQRDSRQRDSIEREGFQRDSRKISKFVGIDPRAVGYVLGKNKINIKDIAADAKEQTGKSVFIQWIPPDIYWGSFKITSHSQNAIDFARDEIKTLEKEFVHKIEDGIFHYPKINKQSFHR